MGSASCPALLPRPSPVQAAGWLHGLLPSRSLNIPPTAFCTASPSLGAVPTRPALRQPSPESPRRPHPTLTLGLGLSSTNLSQQLNVLFLLGSPDAQYLPLY